MKLAFVVAFVLASVLVACSGSDSNDSPTPSATFEPAAEIPVVDITKTEDGFEAPDSIPGGLTRLRVHNAASEPRAVGFGRFAGDGTLEEFNAAIVLAATDFAASAEAFGRLIADGVNTGNIPPGGTLEVVFDLVPGRYVISRGAFGIADMVELEVTAAPEVRPAPPESAFTVSMVEFAFVGFPNTLPAGRTTVEVVNDGQQFHLMDVRRVNEEGITPDQVSRHWNGTPQLVAPTYSAAGGMGELPAGGSGWVTLDLEPGVYTLICYVFDRAEGGEVRGLHVDRGMHHAFTVE